MRTSPALRRSDQVLPGGSRHNSGVQPKGRFPMCMAKANGAYLYDKERQTRYLHFLQAGGPDVSSARQLSGHPVRKKVHRSCVERSAAADCLVSGCDESELMIAREIQPAHAELWNASCSACSAAARNPSLRPAPNGIGRIATAKKSVTRSAAVPPVSPGGSMGLKDWAAARARIARPA